MTIKILFSAMVLTLTAGLAGAFALGFGAPVPPWLVIGAICVGAGFTIALLGVVIHSATASRPA